MNKQNKWKENNQIYMWFDEPHSLPKEVLLPDWACRDIQDTEGDCVEYIYNI